jgi:hypothetical protein
MLTHPLVVALLSLASSPASATDWNVCTSGSCDFASIGAAISSTSVVNGDRLLLSDATTHNTPVALTKSLTIQGSGARRTIQPADSEAITVATGVTATLRNLTLSTGGADDSALAMSGTANVTVDDVQFTAHTSSNDGAGIAATGGTLVVTGSTFTSLIATSTGASDTVGGGIYASATAVTITGSTFTSCQSEGGGGGVYFTGATALVVTGSTFKTNSTQDPDNSNPDGGAISVVSTDLADVTITGSTFDGNTAEDWGGAVALFQADVVNVTDNVFTNDTAPRGGGLGTNDATDLTVLRNQFCDDANYQGGGLAFDGVAGVNLIANNLFVNDQSTGGWGGAIDLWSGLSAEANATPTIRNNTFVGNGNSTANGGGYWTDINSTVDSNIIVLTTSGNGIVVTSGTTVTYNLFNSNTAANSVGVTPGGTNVIGSDPLLWSYSAASDDCLGDFRVRYGGPARNAGNTSGSNNDLDGTRSDIGMYGGPTAATAAWVDADSDGYPWVYDCNEGNAAIHPGVTENGCDGVDNDCDGITDTGGSKPTLYRDGDNDGYGNAAGGTTVACTSAGYAATNDDCNDANAAISPGDPEVCDGSNLDEDCDGLVDDADASATNKTTFYADGDGDGYGTATTSQRCDAGGGYAAATGDCNDAAASVNPGAFEVCDAANVDENCLNGAEDADPSASGKVNYYADGDGDTFGAGTAIPRCDPLTGQVISNTDCNDSNAAIKPGGQEVCDSGNVDEDCDGLTDDGDPSVTGKTSFYSDGDLDGFGAGAASPRCDGGSGLAANNTDCNDSVASIKPGGQELCDAGSVDEDCDGLTDDGDPSVLGSSKTTWYTDADGDTYGLTSSAVQACDANGRRAIGGDCNDAAVAINPGATEVCDGANVDEDCDGQADDLDASATGRLAWYPDGDADTFGDPGPATLACDQPGTDVTNDADCDDTSALYHPGAAEACTDPDYNCDGSVGAVDNDRDQSSACEDCDDADGTVFPGAIEACNAKDDDCDGQTDEAGSTGEVTVYADADGDGFGNLAAPTTRCVPPAGTVANSTDCDDTRTSVRPGGTEVCNGLDDDCNGTVDNGVLVAWYADGDTDGYGAGSAALACTAPSGRVASNTDCDDAANAVHPGATEVCNGVDDDCDGQIDPGLRTTFYADTDQDGYGDVGTTTSACTAPNGYVGTGTDCDDTAATTHPGAPEVCDDVDQDCDGVADDSPTDPTLWYEDADSDGHGSSATAVLACDAPTGFVASSDDCDDATATRFPGAPEQCNGADDDCDGTIDDNVVNVTWYRDFDADGAGNPAVTQVACAQPAGFVLTPDDCDDADATIAPGADEHCDGVDEDCDGTPDDAAVDAPAWYVDTDLDGYGDPAAIVHDCSAPSGAVADATDCDDTDDQVHPGAVEHCDGADEDCDGAIDDNVQNQTYYADIDGDGWGDDASPSSDCTLRSGFAAVGGDCDDGDAAISPGAPEQCNLVDDDCDGDIDSPTPANAPVWYVDADGDSYGDPLAAVQSCAQPTGMVAVGSDCDDTDPRVTDGTDYYRDDDRDGYGIAADTQHTCSPLPGYVDLDGDCDDIRPTVNPGADEVCDRLDDDCDGSIDEDAIDAPMWYVDDDNDQYGQSGSGTTSCAQPAGTAPADGDCDDSDPLVRPNAGEQCNLVDDDCNGLVDDDVVYQDFWIDLDGDGYGEAGSTPTNDCIAPVGTIDNDADCVDDDASVNPSALESCNGIDDDCDGTPDDEASDAAVWFADLDGDGYGTGDPILACDLPPDASPADGDCDDTDDTVSPDAPERCLNGVDDDCDGQIDEGTTEETWYLDSDGDGFGDDATAVLTCSPDADYVTEGGDCDDTDADVNPDAPEIWYDGTDADCSGGSDDDQDGDGFDGNGGDDCDDTDPDVHPGADDVSGDLVDADCDGVDGFPDGDDRPYTPPEDTGVAPPEPKGCECDSGGPSGGALLLGVAAIALARRARRMK